MMGRNTPSNSLRRRGPIIGLTMMNLQGNHGRMCGIHLLSITFSKIIQMKASSDDVVQRTFAMWTLMRKWKVIKKRERRRRKDPKERNLESPPENRRFTVVLWSHPHPQVTSIPTLPSHLETRSNESQKPKNQIQMNHSLSPLASSSRRSPPHITRRPIPHRHNISHALRQSCFGMEMGRGAGLSLIVSSFCSHASIAFP
jgi:hypothetical protein